MCRGGRETSANLDDNRAISPMTSTTTCGESKSEVYRPFVNLGRNRRNLQYCSLGLSLDIEALWHARPIQNCAEHPRAIHCRAQTLGVALQQLLKSRIALSILCRKSPKTAVHSGSYARKSDSLHMSLIGRCSNHGVCRTVSTNSTLSFVVQWIRSPSKACSKPRHQRFLQQPTTMSW